MSNEDFLVYYDKEEMDKFEKEAMKKYGMELGREEGRAKLKAVIQNMIDKGRSL